MILIFLDTDQFLNRRMHVSKEELDVLDTSLGIRTPLQIDRLTYIYIMNKQIVPTPPRGRVMEALGIWYSKPMK